MELAPLLALNARYRTISESFIGFAVQGYPNWKAARHVISEYLNASHGFATRPLPHGLEAFFAERRIVNADRFGSHHLKYLETKWPYRSLTTPTLLSYQGHHRLLNRLRIAAIVQINVRQPKRADSNAYRENSFHLEAPFFVTPGAMLWPAAYIGLTAEGIIEEKAIRALAPIGRPQTAVKAGTHQLAS
jgi:hypothetical protein